MRPADEAKDKGCGVKGWWRKTRVSLCIYVYSSDKDAELCPQGFLAQVFCFAPSGCYTNFFEELMISLAEALWSLGCWRA